MSGHKAEQLRHEASLMRAAAIRLEAIADDMDARDAVEDSEGDHPDLRPRGLKVVGGQ